jgi:hypothetical protein
MIINGIIFQGRGRFGCSDGVRRDQFNVVPMVRALNVRKNIGLEHWISLSLVYSIGWFWIGLHKMLIINRIEYAAVSPVATINIIIIIIF